MSFKPLDLQVNISQINHVARNQHHQQAVPREIQHHQAEHLRRQSEQMQHNVQKSAETSGEGSTVRERDSRQKQDSYSGSDGEPQLKQDEEAATDQKTSRYDDGKGHLIDFTG